MFCLALQYFTSIKLKIGLSKTVTSQKRGNTDNLNIILPQILSSLLQIFTENDAKLNIDKRKTSKWL